MDNPELLSQRPQPWVGQTVSSLDCGISYQPLSQNESIRLLKLLKLHPISDKTNAKVECTLSERSMAECQKRYVALSYTWGNPIARRQIIVNGKPAFITENLYDALTHILRLEGLLAGLLEECELWVDALCINQQDAAEKFVQVANMREVFANAQWVVAWMGPSADGSDELLRDMHNNSITTLPGGEPSLSPEALQAFLARDWWKRMWILQEFIVPHFVWFMCGHSYAHSFDLFGALSTCLSYMDRASYYIVETEFRNTLSWRMYLLLLKERFSSEKQLTMMYLMELAKDAKCMDPRDRVFALLGLMGQEEKRHITCDYNSSPVRYFVTPFGSWPWTLIQVKPGRSRKRWTSGRALPS
ncbi:heterokaryon incompatibility protein-domain-containing protein [Apiosordaria backusii]|uniref:Heterokaryon incompatibility protein-domain-containing protein n=1 Tax=Apiosordaria backusii TaxID=314023 RepID=A0AA40ESA6_9PEZI|nr:heterokaryon incompatibility protein-domain-containing protein [Apiosordaria backusii]